MTFEKDQIYANTTEVIDFAFDEKVARVFPDMVHRSISGYASLLTIMQAVFRSEFANHDNLRVYDLGCAVGAVTLALDKVLPADTQFIGVDLSKDMLSRYETAMQRAQLNTRSSAVCADILTLDLLPANAIALNFTLQFIDPSQRDNVLKKIKQALLPDGLLFLAEKTKTNATIQKWHAQFKKNNGYSDLEIAQKRLAIENVMKIDDESTIYQRLKTAGFNEITPVFHALGFKAWVAK